LPRFGRRGWFELAGRLLGRVHRCGIPALLALAFTLLCAASLIGAVFAVRYLGGAQRPPPPAAAQALHGVLGAASLAALALALRSGVPQSSRGTAGFGAASAGFLAAALLLGVLLALAAWRRRRPNELLVGGHAASAIAALIMLLALLVLG